jgi:hypothetical protein
VGLDGGNASPPFDLSDRELSPRKSFRLKYLSKPRRDDERKIQELSVFAINGAKA